MFYLLVLLDEREVELEVLLLRVDEDRVLEDEFESLLTLLDVEPLLLERVVVDGRVDGCGRDDDLVVVVVDVPVEVLLDLLLVPVVVERDVDPPVDVLSLLGVDVTREEDPVVDVLSLLGEVVALPASPDDVAERDDDREVEVERVDVFLSLDEVAVRDVDPLFDER